MPATSTIKSKEEAAKDIEALLKRLKNQDKKNPRLVGPNNKNNPPKGQGPTNDPRSIAKRAQLRAASSIKTGAVEEDETSEDEEELVDEKMNEESGENSSELRLKNQPEEEEKEDSNKNNPEDIFNDSEEEPENPLARKSGGGVENLEGSNKPEEKSPEKPKSDKEEKTDNKGGGAQDLSSPNTIGTTPLAKDEDKKPENAKKENSKDPEAQEDGIKSGRMAALSVLKKAGEGEEKTAGETAEAVAETGIKMGSGRLLTFLWGSVWLDWTLLSLLGLNVYFFFTLFIKSMAQFGEDWIFGKILSPDLAKYVEIILLVILDMIVLAVISVMLYILYSAVDAITHPYATAWNLLKSGQWGMLWQAIGFYSKN